MPFVEGKLYKVIYEPFDGLTRFNNATLNIEIVVCRVNAFMFLNETENKKCNIFYCISEKEIVSVDAEWSKMNMEEIK